MIEELDFDEIEKSVNEILGGEFEFKIQCWSFCRGDSP